VSRPLAGFSRPFTRIPVHGGPSKPSVCLPLATEQPRLQCFMQPSALTRPRPRTVLPTALFAPAPFPLHSPFEDTALVLTGRTQLPFGALYPPESQPALGTDLPGRPNSNRYYQHTSSLLLTEIHLTTRQ
jgi:hypothetical protein